MGEKGDYFLRIWGEVWENCRRELIFEVPWVMSHSLSGKKWRKEEKNKTMEVLRLLPLSGENRGWALAVHSVNGHMVGKSSHLNIIIENNTYHKSICANIYVLIPPFECKKSFSCISFLLCFLPVPPQIMNISSDITVNEGSSVTLLCLAIGRPEPTVTWRHLSVKGKAFTFGNFSELFFRVQAGRENLPSAWPLA